ncbi:hypothetical protein GCM10027270_35490 [Nocardioides ginkgobilobae]
MLLDAAELGPGDQQHGVGAAQGVGDGCLVVAVDSEDLHATIGEVGEPLRGAPGGADVGGGDAALEKRLDRESSEVAGGSDDGDGAGPGWFLSWVTLTLAPTGPSSRYFPLGSRHLEVPRLPEG